MGSAAAGRRPAAGRVIDVEPPDPAWAKLQLDARRNALASSVPTPGRTMALRQIAGLRMSYERRQTLPMRLVVTVVVRVADRHTLERRTKRLRQRAIGTVVDRSHVSRRPDHIVLRVTDDGARGRPAGLSTQVVLLRGTRASARVTVAAG